MVSSYPSGSAGPSASAASTVKCPQTACEVAERLFELVFSAADTDRSGFIDHAEFGILLQHLGRETPPDVAQHCLARYILCSLSAFRSQEFLCSCERRPMVQELVGNSGPSYRDGRDWSVDGMHTWDRLKTWQRLSTSVTELIPSSSGALALTLTLEDRIEAQHPR